MPEPENSYPLLRKPLTDHLKTQIETCTRRFEFVMFRRYILNLDRDPTFRRSFNEPDIRRIQKLAEEQLNERFNKLIGSAARITIVDLEKKLDDILEEERLVPYKYF